MDAKTDKIVTLMPGRIAVARTNPIQEAGNGTNDYYACGASLDDEVPGNETWFRIHGIFAKQDDSIEMCRYDDIRKVYSPAHGMVMIDCHDCTYVLEGRNLTSVILLIQDRRLRALYPFESGYDREPEDESKPFIRSITRYHDEL